MNVLSIEDEEFQEMVRVKLLGNMVNNGATQRVVDVNELESFLAVKMLKLIKRL
ncbi:MAG: hypothetical protein FGF52_06550 [Candidatus Brockarchaeota archaeon]|nr:hypothetical protein [Candidatus Brockarchaeota archaeon]